MNKIAFSMKKFFSFISTSYTKPKLGRWQINDNISKKIDLANIDNCGDRVCGDIQNSYNHKQPIIDLYEKKWKGDISDYEFKQKLSEINNL